VLRACTLSKAKVPAPRSLRMRYGARGLRGALMRRMNSERYRREPVCRQAGGGLQRSGLSVHPTPAVPSAAAASSRIGSRYSILSSSSSSSSSSPVLPCLPGLPGLPVAGAPYPLPYRITDGNCEKQVCGEPRMDANGRECTRKWIKRVDEACRLRVGLSVGLSECFALTTCPHTLSPHLVSTLCRLHFVQTLCPYALS